MTTQIREKSTFCRICEPNCPIIARFDADGRLEKLVPDEEHPSGGVACHKGLSYDEVNRDPDRLDRPQQRLNPKVEPKGDFTDVTWDAAMEEIGRRTRAIRERFGNHSVAVYLGNPFAFNAAALLMAAQFQDLLDTPMRFSANTQDAANRFAAIGAVYGCGEAVMVPDIPNTDYLLCIGSNPKVSRWTTMSQPNNWDAVKDIRRRGGKILFVNPRRTESSTQDTGPTLLIRPGTDVYFLAAVLNEIAAITGFRSEQIERYGRNVDGLRAFVSAYPADRVGPITGIEPDAIREVARDFLSAKSAVACAATGVNQSRQGLLCAWLVEMLNFVTGNLGRKGGSYRPGGLVDHFTPAGARRQVETSLGSFSLPDPIGFSVLPGALLGDLVESGDIRALFVLGGNPLLSVGGGDRAKAAYAKLDLLVTLDIYRSATGEVSDFVLPSTDWLERPDINLIAMGHQPRPYVQYCDAVVEPAAERRNDWWILARLAQAIGLDSPLDEDSVDVVGQRTIDGLLGAAGLSVETMRSLRSGTASLPTATHESLFERCLKHPDGKLDCMPQSFIDEGLRERCAAILAEMEAQGERQLRLISLRTPYLHNSWLNNSERFRKGKNAENPLHMNQADAAERSLIAGDRVRVCTEFGEVEAHLLIDNDLCSGAVAMSHGYGQGHSHALQVAKRNAGANCNGLMPVGLNSYEPISYMSWLSGVPVDVERVREVGGAAGAEADETEKVGRVADQL